MITQKDAAEMTQAELAALAAKAPAGFTPVFYSDGQFGFHADWAIEKMQPSERAKLRVIGRAH